MRCGGIFPLACDTSIAAGGGFAANVNVASVALALVSNVPPFHQSQTIFNTSQTLQ